jgi:hypothetical protein
MKLPDLRRLDVTGVVLLAVLVLIGLIGPVVADTLRERLRPAVSNPPCARVVGLARAYCTGPQTTDTPRSLR